ncbi:MAG: Fe-S-containing hydro-lyase [Firmicutes bacterium]|nr:Fe-S-containing hydro-lyase [Bacillota bacterium]
MEIRLPLTDDTIDKLKSGDHLSLCGILYVARDAAHKRIIESLEKGEKPPFDLKGQTIYYMGPSPAREGRVIGSAGPTTSGRMDVYAVSFMQEGIKGMIGKGSRSMEVREAIKKYRAVYMASIGGAGALISQCIKKADLIAYEDLGAEAVYRLEVENFPVWVVNDIYGGDLYEEGRKRYRKI